MGRPAAPRETELHREGEGADVRVGGHELVDDLRVVVLGHLGAERGEGLGQPRQLARPAVTHGTASSGST